MSQAAHKLKSGEPQPEEGKPPSCASALLIPTDNAPASNAVEPPRLSLLSQKVPSATPSGAAFRKKYFPGVSAAQWNDWRWQVRNRISGPQALKGILNLTPEEEQAFAGEGGHLPLGITPYYLGLIDPEDPASPLRRAVVPSIRESVLSPGESIDPLGENKDTVAPCLVHRYPDRVLLLATGFCSTYCRYCTRSRLVGGHEQSKSRRDLEAAFSYIAAHDEIRDVLVSGGDPLTMANDRLDWILGRLRAISHVEIIRIGTKTPAVLPQRITPDLVRMLRRHHPLFLSLHFTHPAELTVDTVRACARLADAGIPLGSQTVLLAGVNDDVGTMRRLNQGLLRCRVKPYYLYQCDPIAGSAHFRTPVAKGLEIMEGLRGHTSGYAVPTFVIDAPGGGGKIALYPESVVSHENGELRLRSYDGGIYTYPDFQAGPCPDLC